MKSIEDKVLDQIMLLDRGQLFFPTDFHELGLPEAIRLALHRLEKTK